jgi:hypothetical protein
MLKAERASLPVNRQIGSRRLDVKRIAIAWPNDLLDYTLSAERVAAIPQYLPDLITAKFVFFERNQSLSLPSLNVDPYSAIIE